MEDKVMIYQEIKDVVEQKLNDREEITNRRGNVVIPRKYHMTDAQIEKKRQKWLSTIDIDSEIKDKAGKIFFNPYRENGSYYGAVQALYLLGANEWHSYIHIKKKMEKDMSTRNCSKKNRNCWDNFSMKGTREGAVCTKDLMGRIIQNFRTLQRLGGVHPYGWKLKQLRSSIDIYRDIDGKWYFKLNTKWSNIDKVAPKFNIIGLEDNEKKIEKVEVSKLVKV